MAGAGTVGGGRRLVLVNRRRFLRHRGDPDEPEPAPLPTFEAVTTDVGELLLPAHDSVMRALMKRTGDWELDEASLFASLLRPGMTVLDVGAHVGYYTLLAARLLGPEGRVIAVEADPDNAALLAANVARNRAGNVEIVKAAAWNQTGRVALRRNPQNTGDHRVLGEAPTAGGVEVDSIALDDWLGEDPIHAVKVDAQGSDHIAIQGMERALRRWHPIVFVEFYPKGIEELGRDPTDVAAYYRSLDARLTMPGLQADFDAWLPQDFVSSAKRLPGGFGTIVIRPRRTT